MEKRRGSAVVAANITRPDRNSKGQRPPKLAGTNNKVSHSIPQVILNPPDSIYDEKNSGNLTGVDMTERDYANESPPVSVTARKAKRRESIKDNVDEKPASDNGISTNGSSNPLSFPERKKAADCHQKDENNGINSAASSRSNSLQDPVVPLENGSVLSLKRCSAGSIAESTDGANGAGGAKMTRKGKIGAISKGSQWSKLRNVIKASGAVNQEFKKRKMNSGLHRDDSFLRKFSTRNYRARSVGSTAESDEGGTGQPQQVYMYPEEMIKAEGPVIKVTVIRPEGSIMFYWLAIVTLAVLYNLWTCIAREAFPEIVTGHLTMWILMDVLCDLIYVLDIGVQFRTGYLEQGLMVYSSKKLSKRYAFSQYFIIDIVSILPLDFLQFAIGVHPMLRFPRFLKAHRLYSFIYKLESRTQYPNLFRVTNLTHILFLGAHWFAAFYFMISKAEGFHSQWSYPKPEGEFASATRKYLMSLYWSTLTLTTIGDLPEPNTTWEYVFVIVSYLIGVFVFATIVGQVGNVITNRNASRHDFERLLDGAKSYMRRHNVPKDMRKRVLRWYDYVWSRGRMDGSWDINSLGLLPDKLKTELAIHVNLETLKKVTIFQECQPEFLHDLVLKMKAYIFTPGDLICRHGEIAREMFIIADGVVEVISENGTVMTRMSTGDFFGEIGILNLDEGINRRTADVRSVGYSELFVLSRDDVLSALKDHPEAEKLLKDYGRQRLSVVRRLANMDVEMDRPPEIKIRSNSSPSLRLPMEDNPSPVTDLLSIQVPSRIM